MQTNIAVSKVITQRLSAPYSGCVDSLESTKSAFADAFASKNFSYSQLDCFTFCWQRKVMEACGCYDLTYDFKYPQKPCLNSSQLLCMYNTSEKFFSYEIFSNCSEDCPEECSLFMYSHSISFSNYPSEVYKILRKFYI